MKKETAMKYADILNENTILSFWADYDSIKKTWYVHNVFRRFYTVKELKNYAGGRMK